MLLKWANEGFKSEVTAVFVAVVIGPVILWGGYGTVLWIVKGFKEDQKEDQPPDS